MCFRIHVHGFPGRFAGPEEARREWTTLHQNESEGWARAALGELWSDYAYELVPGIPDSRPPSRRHDHVYFVFVDAAGRPVLAPDNTRWDSVEGMRASPRKLQPNTSNTELIAHLDRVGPFAATGGIRDPRTDPDGGWRIEITGDSPDTLNSAARATFERACAAFRVRGAVSRYFRTTRVELDGMIVRVYFHWKDNPNLFAMAFALPSGGEDFGNYPADSPAGVVRSVMLDWMEELETGALARRHRRRVNGVLHILGNPTQPMDDDYFVSGAAVPSPPPASEADRDTANHDRVTLRCTVTAHAAQDPLRTAVARASAHWIASTTALFDVLDVDPGTPDSVPHRSAHRITHQFADAGAREILTTFTHPCLLGLGYLPGTQPDTCHLDVTTMP